MYRIFFSITIVFCLIGCQSKDDPLYKAIKDVESSWSSGKLKEFAGKPDSVAIIEEHFGNAMIFRNKELHNPKDSTLLKYFHSLGIYQEDYMSSIVFASLHRKLNNKPIDLEAQIANVRSVINEVKERDDKNITRAKSYHSKYQVGDTILVRMPVDKGSAYSHSYPEDSRWVFNDSLDLLIKGIILSKDEMKNTSDIFFKLKVLSKNKNSINVLMEDIQVGDEMEIDLLHDIVESPRSR